MHHYNKSLSLHAVSQGQLNLPQSSLTSRPTQNSPLYYYIYRYFRIETKTFRIWFGPNLLMTILRYVATQQLTALCLKSTYTFDNKRPGFLSTHPSKIGYMYMTCLFNYFPSATHSYKYIKPYTDVFCKSKMDWSELCSCEHVHFLFVHIFYIVAKLCTR